MQGIVPALQEAIAQMITVLPRLVVSILVFLLALVAAGLLSRAVARRMERRSVPPEMVLLGKQITRWTCIILGAIVALEQVDFNVLAFLTGLGIAGFTVGFALQDVSKNFVAGILLLLERPFEMGDVIRVGAYLGTVETVTLRTTAMRMVDGGRVLVPNAQVLVSAIESYARGTRRRLELRVGVSYESDLRTVRDVALEAVKGIDGVVDDPAPQVVFDAFGPTTIDGTVSYWIDTATTSILRAKDAGVEALQRAFRDAQIDMPFPTQVIHLHQ